MSYRERSAKASSWMEMRLTFFSSGITPSSYWLRMAWAAAAS